MDKRERYFMSEAYEALFQAGFTGGAIAIACNVPYREIAWWLDYRYTAMKPEEREKFTKLTEMYNNGCGEEEMIAAGFTERDIKFWNNQAPWSSDVEGMEDICINDKFYGEVE
jgi:hypothetical protein